MADPPSADPVYVANDAAACGSYAPCYINSDSEDLEKIGIGTGLKDAIDASLATLNTNILVLGNYTINADTVVVDQPVSIAGVGNAKITYSGPNNLSACQNGMLDLNAAVTLSGLNIDDGNCTTANRDLLSITSGDSADVVTIELNNLSGGNHAIFVGGSNLAEIDVRFNNITGNAGRAILFDPTGSSVLNATANNITNNMTSSPAIPPVDCVDPAVRRADHNYWGAAAPANTNCTIDPNKRLGAPILHNPSAPGVRAKKVEVTPNRADAADDFGNQIAYYHHGSDGRKFLYLCCRPWLYDGIRPAFWRREPQPVQRFLGCVPCRWRGSSQYQ